MRFLEKIFHVQEKKLEETKLTTPNYKYGSYKTNGLPFTLRVNNAMLRCY